ncbi:MAG: chemotaxis protein CheW [Spirochaetia bacterium]|nr:chemotaxis protein CheW [Spirochaetota bacterium]MCX8095915.1 chemotaxis protein CheW [Spirochaetota bacterium]MDW8112249.1 chemotaxis protein CheW [Spirochaetia bacterium]
MKFVTFSVYNQKYAVDIAYTEEVMVMLPYLEVPHSYEFVEGVVDIRGEIVPVISLRKRFGVFEENKGKTYLVVVTVDGKKYGLRVDSVEGVIDANETEMSSSSELGEISSEFITSVVRKNTELFIVLDVKKLIEIKQVV